VKQLESPGINQAKSTCSVGNVSVFCGLDPRKSFLVGNIPTFWAKNSKKKLSQGFWWSSDLPPKKENRTTITTTFVQEKQTNPWDFMDCFKGKSTGNHGFYHLK
jgi:hypothetical protein